MALAHLGGALWTAPQPGGSLDLTPVFGDRQFEQWTLHWAAKSDLGLVALFDSIKKAKKGLVLHPEFIEVFQDPLLRIGVASLSDRDRAMMEELKGSGMFSQVSKIASGAKTVYGGFVVPIVVNSLAVIRRLAIHLIKKSDQPVNTAISVIFALRRCGLGVLKEKIIEEFESIDTSAPKQLTCDSCGGVKPDTHIMSFSRTPEEMERFIEAICTRVPNVRETLGLAPKTELQVLQLVAHGVLYDHALGRPGPRACYSGHPELKLILDQFWLGHPVPRGCTVGVYWHTPPLDPDSLGLLVSDLPPDDDEPLSPISSLGLKVGHFRKRVAIKSTDGVAFCHPTPVMFGGSVGLITPEQRGEQYSWILDRLFKDQQKKKRSRTEKRPLYRLVHQAFIYGELEITSRILRSWMSIDMRSGGNHLAEGDSLPPRLLNRECWREVFELIELLWRREPDNFRFSVLTLLSAFLMPYGPRYWIGDQAHSGQSADAFIEELLLRSPNSAMGRLTILLELKASKGAAPYEHDFYSKEPFKVKMDERLGDIPVVERDIPAVVWALFYAENGPKATGIGDPTFLGTCTLNYKVVEIERLFLGTHRLAKPPFIVPDLQEIRRPTHCSCPPPPTQEEIEEALQREEIEARRAAARAQRQREAEESEAAHSEEWKWRNWANSGGISADLDSETQAAVDNYRKSISEFKWSD